MTYIYRKVREYLSHFDGKKDLSRGDKAGSEPAATYF